MSNSKGSILISNANAVGTALVNKLGGTGYTPNEWADKINLLGIADADIPTALAGITEGSYAGEERGAIKICNANNVGTMLNKKFNTNRGFKPSEWESAIDKLTALTTGTVSGSVVSFSDGADDVPLVNCIASVDPVQDLHGYSKPWAPGSGKNKLENELTSQTLNGTTFTVNSDGSITISGTPSVQTRVYIKSGTAYTVNEVSMFSTGTMPTGTRVFAQKVSEGSTTYPTISPSSTLSTIGSVYSNILLEIGTSFDGTSFTIYPMIEVGSTATTYEPYSNICPISGRTEIDVMATGKNLFDKNSVENYTWIVANSTETEPTVSYRTSGYIPVKANTKYYVSTKSSNRSAYYDRNKNGIAYFSFSGGASFTCLYDGYIRITINNNVDLDTFIVNEGDEAIVYEPFGTTYTAQLGTTIYGGSADVVNGSGSETWEKKVYTGADNEYWVLSKSGDVYRYYVINDNVKQPTGRGVVYSSIGEYSATSNEPGTCFTYYSSGINRVLIYYIPPQTIQTVEAFRAWLSSNNFDAVYEKVTSEPFSFESVPINSKKGNNTIWSDGDTSVTYYKGV